MCFANNLDFASMFISEITLNPSFSYYLCPDFTIITPSYNMIRLGIFPYFLCSIIVCVKLKISFPEYFVEFNSKGMWNWYFILLMEKLLELMKLVSLVISKSV